MTAIAPPVRNYLRIAQASFVRSFSLLLLFPSLALLRLTSGLGRPEELSAELMAARALLDSTPGGR